MALVTTSERPVLPASPDDVLLTEEEKQEAIVPAVNAALQSARAKKWAALKTARYYWDLSNPEEARRLGLDDLKRTYMAAAKEQIHPEYATDHGLGDVLHTLSLYFAQDPDFAGRGKNYSLKKGLFIVGTVGVGKSSMMRVWGQVNQTLRFGVVSCRKVADRFTEMGADGLEVYSQAHHSGGVCFDDLGTEALTTKHYGNEETPMATVLLNRYDEFQAGRLKPCATHITTNLTLDALRAHYGDRVADRVKEMFNILVIPQTAPSRRK